MREYLLEDSMKVWISVEYGSPTASVELEQKKLTREIKCYIVLDSVPGSRFGKLDEYCIIHGTKTHSLLFDISAIKMQSFHHKTTFLPFFQIFRKTPNIQCVPKSDRVLN